MPSSADIDHLEEEIEIFERPTPPDLITTVLSRNHSHDDILHHRPLICSAR